MMSNFRQLGGTLSAVWFVLVSAGAKEDHLSPATVKNLIRDIDWFPWKVGGDEKKLTSAIVNTAECEPVNLLRKTWVYPSAVLLELQKPDFTVVPCTCPHSLAMPVLSAAALHGPSKLCCRQDTPLTPKNYPAGPELHRPGFLALFAPYVCEQASPAACGHGGDVNEHINTAILIKGCAEWGALQLMQSCFERLWGIHRILINLDHFTFIEGFYYPF